jgi:crotonobetainyl-CoA:carnitine CoA-transferase CaiB-like acyl-CoA transferase
LRVLDLTRVIASPVAGRALAAHGADVMRISAPGLPFIDWLAKDTGRGKFSAYADIATPDGKAALARLVEEADIFLQAFRPGAFASRGFGFSDVTAMRPGIVYGSLSAYGESGPWASRRGFDSLVQTTTGFNFADAQAAGVEGRRNCPVRRSIMQLAICWHSGRSWRGCARRAKAATGWCAYRLPRPGGGFGTSAVSAIDFPAHFRRATM